MYRILLELNVVFRILLQLTKKFQEAYPTPFPLPKLTNVNQHTSAPNHSCPAKFSCRTSSGNFTRKSRFAFWLPMASSMIFCTTTRTLSWHALSLLTRTVHLSGSFLPSKLSSSAATSFSSSSAKKNWANIELSLFCNCTKKRIS